MKVNVLKQSKNVLKFEVIGEDHSFCNALQDMLLKEKDIDFAGYSIDHPLISEPVFYIRAKKGVDVRSKLLKAAKKLEKRSDTFLKTFEKAWKEESGR